MANPGQSNDFHVAPGTLKWRKLEAAGFTADDLNAWKSEETAKLQAAGFQQHELDEYWGASRAAPTAARGLAQANLSRAQAADTPWEMIQAGFGVTAAGLLKDHGAPKYVLPSDAGIFAKTMSGLGQIAGDAPIAIPAFFAGMAPGASVGGAIGGVVTAPAGGVGAIPGAAIGGVVGGGFAAGAAPVAAREAVLAAYNRGEIDNPDEFWAQLTHSAIEVGKGGLIGAVTAPLGLAARTGVAQVAAPKVFAAAADVTTQALGGTALGGALNGQMPTRSDFVAGLLTGFATEGALLVKDHQGQQTLTEGGKHVKSNAETIYRRAGVPPKESGRRAQSNPALKQELIQQNVYGESIIPRHMAEAPPEVEPYVKPAAEGAEAPTRKFGTPADTGASAAKLLRGFEGFSATAYWDVNHYRTGYGSDTVTNPDGTYRATRQGDRVDQAGAERDLARRLNTQFLPLAREAVGQEWHRLDTDTQAALVSITYNYGRLPTSVARAARRGDPEALAEAVEQLQFHNGGVNKDRRLKEAEIIRGGGGKGPPGGGEPPAAGGEGGPVVPFGKRRPLAEVTPETIAADSAEWASKTADERYKAAMEMVGDPKKDGLLDLLDPDLLVDQYVSELRPARVIDNEIFASHPEFDRKKTYGLEDAFRNTYASDDRAGLFLKHGPVDGETNEFVGTKDSPSLDRAVKQLKKAGGNVSDWRAYMLALRTVEKSAQGIETGMDPALAHSIAHDPKEFAKYKEAVATFQKTGHGVLQYAVAKGRYSPEQAARIVKNNIFWVSMRRAQGDNEAFKPAAFGKFKVGPGIRKMEGGDGKVVDPIMASIDNWRMIVADADRNEAAMTVVRAAEGGLIPPEWGVKHVYTLGEGDLSKSTDLAPYVAPDELSELTQALAPDLAIKAFKERGDAGEFLVFRDGKPEVWTTKSEALARLLRGAESASEANIIVAAAGAYAGLKRAGITSTPEFAFKTAFADQLGAFITDPSHPPPFVTLALGAIPALTHNKIWKDWAAAGGAGSAAAAMDTNFLTRDMGRLFDETGFTGKVWNLMKTPVEAMQTLQERVDSAQRIGHFRWSQKVGGMEPRRAAMQGRKTYIDFKERATLQLVNTWSKMTPFLRPFLLGMKNIGEAVAERPLETGMALAAFGIVATGFALLNQMNDDDLPETEKWANLPDYAKDMYMTLPEIAGIRLKIGTRDALSVVNSFAWRSVEFMKTHDPHAYDGMLKFFAKQFMFDLTPAIAQPVMEDRANYSYFMDRPLIPSSLEKASGPAQYTENTTETAKKLAQWLGNEDNPLSTLELARNSPIIIDNYIRQTLGTGGVTIARVLDPGDKEVQRPQEITDNPFVAAFVHREARANAQPISDFYDAYEKVQTAQADLKLAKKRGDREELVAARQDPMASVNVSQVAQALKEQRDQLTRVYHNKDMTVDEKRQFSERLYVRMIATAERGTQLIRKRQALADEHEAEVQQRKSALGPLSVQDQPEPAPVTPPVAPHAGGVPLA